MYYIFNQENVCVGSCSALPDDEDLASRKEYCIELDNASIGDVYLESRIITPIKKLTQEEIDYKSKINRITAIAADILFSEVYYQVTNDCADIKSALMEASILGLDDSYSQSWRLSDNTWRNTTIAEAKEIVTLYVARKQKVWVQYEVWTLGDKTSVFEYIEE